MMGSASLVIAAWTLLFQETPSLQDSARKKQDLMRRAGEAYSRDDRVGGTRLTAEAWAVQADIDWDSLRPECAEEAFTEARRLGWMGTPPWELRPRRTLQQEEPVPPLKPEDFPLFERPAKPRRQKTADTWPYLATAPYHHARNSTWHSMFNTPAFEEALVPPEGTWHLRTWIELSTSDFQNTAGGGRTQWITDFHQENFELNYSYSDQWQFGIRFSMGELFEYNDIEIRVFENGRQIVPNGLRQFDADSVVLRAKFAGEAGFGDVGVLAELKFPLGYVDSLLSASTFDLGISGLYTKRWDDWILHANAGFVFPIGTPDLFVSAFDDAGLYLTGAIGVNYIWNRTLVVGAQIEMTTTAFKDLAALNEPVIAFLIHSRARLDAGAYLGLGLQKGLTDFSGNWMFSTTLDFTF